MENGETVPKRDKSGKFAKGGSGGPGRPPSKSSASISTEQLIDLSQPLSHSDLIILSKIAARAFSELEELRRSTDISDEVMAVLEMHVANQKMASRALFLRLQAECEA